MFFHFLKLRHMEISATAGERCIFKRNWALLSGSFKGLALIPACKGGGVQWGRTRGSGGFSASLARRGATPGTRGCEERTGPEQARVAMATARRCGHGGAGEGRG